MRAKYVQPTLVSEELLRTNYAFSGMKTVRECLEEFGRCKYGSDFIAVVGLSQGEQFDRKTKEEFPLDERQRMFRAKFVFWKEKETDDAWAV